MISVPRWSGWGDLPEDGVALRLSQVGDPTSAVSGRFDLLRSRPWLWPTPGLLDAVATHVLGPAPLHGYASGYMVTPIVTIGYA